MGGSHSICVGGTGDVHTGFWWGNLRERGHLEDPGIDGRIILKWILGKWDGGYGLDWFGAGKGQVAGSCDCSDELSGSIKYGVLSSWGPIGFSRRTVLHGVGQLIPFLKLKNTRFSEHCALCIYISLWPPPLHSSFLNLLTSFQEMCCEYYATGEHLIPYFLIACNLRWQRGWHTNFVGRSSSGATSVCVLAWWTVIDFGKHDFC